MTLQPLSFRVQPCDIGSQASAPWRSVLSGKIYETDAEMVTYLKELKPVFWDKTLEVFKDRNATRYA